MEEMGKCKEQKTEAGYIGLRRDGVAWVCGYDSQWKSAEW